MIMIQKNFAVEDQDILTDPGTTIIAAKMNLQYETVVMEELLAAKKGVL